MAKAASPHGPMVLAFSRVCCGSKSSSVGASDQVFSYGRPTGRLCYYHLIL